MESRPFRGINNKWGVPEMSVIDKLLLIVLVLLVTGVLWLCFNATPGKSQRVVNPDVKADIHRLLDKRGISRATTVEITPEGYRFEWNGKWVKL